MHYAFEIFCLGKHFVSFAFARLHWENSWENVLEYSFHLGYETLHYALEIFFIEKPFANKTYCLCFRKYVPPMKIQNMFYIFHHKYTHINRFIYLLYFLFKRRNIQQSVVVQQLSVINVWMKNPWHHRNLKWNIHTFVYIMYS